MFTILSALALLAASAGDGTDDKTIHGGPSPDDKTIHSAPSPDDKTIHSCTDGWEVGSICKDADGVTWIYDGYSWVPDAYTW